MQSNQIKSNQIGEGGRVEQDRAPLFLFSQAWVRGEMPVTYLAKAIASDRLGFQAGSP